MSFQIDTALVQSYKSGIDIKFQQKGSRLRPFVRVESQNAEFEYYDRITATAAVKKVTRHGDTPLISTPHDRRRIGLQDYHWADLIDKRDKLRMLSDPTSPYTVNAVNALGRAMDDEIINAATGVAYTGKDGNTQVTFPTSTQQVPVNFVYGTDANTNLTVDKLRKAKDMLGKAEAFEDSDQLVAAVTQSQITSLLGSTQITSADYNSVKALVNGEVDTFMGFKFVRTERLLKSGNNRSALLYVQSGLLMAVADETTVEVTKRADKNYSVQVYVEGSFSATRMWEEQVVEVLCDETAE